MPERRRLGIRALLLALLLPGVVALLLLDSWNDYRAVSRIVEDAYDQALLEPVQALDDSVGFGPDGTPRVDAAFSVQSMFEVTRSRHKYLHVGVTHGSAAAQTLVGVDDLPAPPPSADGVPVFYNAKYRGAPIRIAALRRTLQGADAQPYRVLSQAAESTGTREQAEAQALHQAMWSGLRLVALMVLLVCVGIAWALRPLERLRRALQARSPAQLAPLDAQAVPHEVAPLVEAVNHHIAGHRQLLAEQSRFLADASHQLRTPLAIMLTQAGYAMREPAIGPMRESLHAIVAQLSRARRLSEQLLALAHASETRADEPAPPRRCDLNAVARQVVLQYLPLAREKQQDLGWVDARGEAAVDADDSDSNNDHNATGAPTAAVAPAAADAEEVHEILSNLVHNAIKYTPPGGRITVSVTRGDTTMEARVHDTGPGIAPARRAAVFERFHRAADGGDASQRGAGLGLAIARAYARRNGGDIVLEDGGGDGGGNVGGGDAPGQRGGLCAVLRLPCAATAADPRGPVSP